MVSMFVLETAESESPDLPYYPSGSSTPDPSFLSLKSTTAVPIALTTVACEEIVLNIERRHTSEQSSIGNNKRRQILQDKREEKEKRGLNTV